MNEIEGLVKQAARDAGAQGLTPEAMAALCECVDDATRTVLSVALMDCADRGGAQLEPRDLETARRMYGVLWGEPEKQ